ncbi:MAG: hypothetical protein JWM87_203 [Candidatus Eremiobacteraeota bacterium]|nr:hypothetical protein [Candidatus Eremiobacteraeota bacterium]
MSMVHSPEAIQAMLRRGLAPITDNRHALVALGFERAYPQVARGRDSTIWERSIELPCRTANGSRLLARERAFLERARA